MTLNHVAEGYIDVSDRAGVVASLFYRKSKAAPRPLRLSYPINPAWAYGSGPHHLFLKWITARTGGIGFFNLRAAYPLGRASLATSSVIPELLVYQTMLLCFAAR